MDFWRTLRVLVRRWYVVVPAFLLTVGAAALVFTSVPPTYVSYGVLVLNTPVTGSIEPNDPKSEVGLVNPLLNFDQGLSMSGSILIQALSHPETSAELGVLPDSPTRYKVHNGSTNPELLTSGPFIVIDGESTTAADARSIVQRVAERAVVELAKRQESLQAPKSTYITVNQVVSATTPEELNGSKARAAASALAVGMAVSLFAAFAFESFATRRRRRTDAALPPGVGPAGNGAVDPQPREPTSARV
jgi:capsular polysaccharide biosynthesis protein